MKKLCLLWLLVMTLVYSGICFLCGQQKRDLKPVLLKQSQIYHPICKDCLERLNWLVRGDTKKV